MAGGLDGPTSSRASQLLPATYHFGWCPDGDARLDLVAPTQGDKDTVRVFLGSGGATFP